MTHPSAGDDTVVAEQRGSIIGFVHTILDHDPVLGALLDNLHVAQGVKRTGIGTQLMAHPAFAVNASVKRSTRPPEEGASSGSCMRGKTRPFFSRRRNGGAGEDGTDYFLMP